LWWYYWYCIDPVFIEIWWLFIVIGWWRWCDLNVGDYWPVMWYCCGTSDCDDDDMLVFGIIVLFECYWLLFVDVFIDWYCSSIDEIVSLWSALVLLFSIEVLMCIWCLSIVVSIQYSVICDWCWYCYWYCGCELSMLSISIDIYFIYWWLLIPVGLGVIVYCDNWPNLLLLLCIWA